MTQVTEDLRAAEPADALSSTLREKLLGVPLAPNNGGTGMEEGDQDRLASPSDSPIIGGRGASSRKRPVLAWGLAAAALIAWFICFPLFQKTRGGNSPTSMGASSLPLRAGTQTASVPIASPLTLREKALRPPPPMPESVNAPGAIPPPPPDIARPVASERSAVTFASPAAGASAVKSDNFSPPLAPIGDPDSLRQVHKEASIGVQVADPETTGDKINAMVQETGGYVAANNLTTGDDGRRSAELIVKVPEAQFETFLNAVAKLGVVQSKNITGQDITETTSDAHEAQSVEESDLEQAEARLKALGSHAKWEDTEAASDLRVQLAQTRARLKLLKRMAALGTITVDLGETPKGAVVPPVTGGFLNTLQTTTHDALQSLVGSAAALVALVIWLLAYAPIWLPLLLLGRYALKEYRKREAA